MIPERVWQWYWPTNAKGMSGINVIAHEWGNHCSTVYEFFKTQGLIPKSVSISLLYDNRKLDHFLVRLLQNSAHLTILIDGTERLQFSHLHLFLNLIEKSYLYSLENSIQTSEIFAETGIALFFVKQSKAGFCYFGISLTCWFCTNSTSYSWATFSDFSIIKLPLILRFWCCTTSMLTYLMNGLLFLNST